MPYNGTGTFNLTYNWENDAANGIDITASRFDTQEGDMAANGLSICITRDGQGVPTTDIPWGGNKITGIKNGTNAQDAVAYGQVTSVIGAQTGFLGGLTLSTAGASGTFGIAAGLATDSTSALSLNLASAFTKTTSAFSAGTGNGALDASSIANSTWYHVFIIGGPSVTADILLSLSPTAPTLPGSYTLFRRIGSMKTDSSAHWILFTQKGNEFLWGVQTQDVTLVIPGSSSAVTPTVTVPTGVQVNALLALRAAYGSTTDFWLMTSPDQTDTAPTSTGGTGIYTFFVNSNQQFVWLTLSIRTNTSAQIRARASQGPGNPTSAYYLQTTGWIDARGQG